MFFFFFQAEDGIRDFHVTGVQTCALPILLRALQEYRFEGVPTTIPAHLTLLGHPEFVDGSYTTRTLESGALDALAAPKKGAGAGAGGAGASAGAAGAGGAGASAGAAGADAGAGAGSDADSVGTRIRA